MADAPRIAQRPEPRDLAELRALRTTQPQLAPAIDLQIFFDYDSAELGPRAQPTLIALGNVLSKADFKGTVFLINGHTDARGSAPSELASTTRRGQAAPHYQIGVLLWRR